MKKIYIVTGANGFLGNNIVRSLQNEDAEIRCLVLPNDKVNSLEGLKCKVYYGDVRDYDSLKEIFDVDGDLCVIHTAAIVSISNKFNPNIYDVNVTGTKNVVRRVLEHNAKLIYVNSVHAIPVKPNNEPISEIYDFNPDNVNGVYAKTKAVAAKYVLGCVKKHNLNATIVQPSGIIGPNDYATTHLTNMIIQFANKKIKSCVTGGYSFVDVRDVANIIVKLTKMDKKGECYIISNKSMSIKDIFDIVSDICKLNQAKVMPMWLAKLAAPFIEKTYNFKNQLPLFTKYSLYTLEANANFDTSKAQKELDFVPTDYHKTIEDTIKWLEDNGRIKS